MEFAHTCLNPCQCNFFKRLRQLKKETIQLNCLVAGSNTFAFGENGSFTDECEVVVYPREFTVEWIVEGKKTEEKVKEERRLENEKRLLKDKLYKEYLESKEETE